MSDVALIKPKTSLEELHSRMQEEVASQDGSRFNLQRKMVLFRRICSVYFFLRKEFGIARRPMSLEEFELGERALKELAESKLRGFGNGIARFFGIRHRWAYYLKHGHFGMSTPFGSWCDDGGWYLRRSAMDPETNLRSCSWTIHPPNSTELLNELFRKEYMQEEVS